MKKTIIFPSFSGLMLLRAVSLKKTVFLFCFIAFAGSAFAQHDLYGKARLINKQQDGYRGIWYHIAGAGQAGPVKNEYKYKYSGGLGVYPSNHYPFSVYAKKVNKTFFCYGGTDEAGKTLLHTVSYYDHKTGKVPRPTVLLDKATGDAHDNPVMQIDKDGYIWIFSTSHGTGRPSFIHKSKAPYDIEAFELVPATKVVDGEKIPLNNFSYLQIYYSDKEGFVGLFTHYENVGGRVIGWMTSKDGVEWSEWKDLSILDQGQYQTSGKKGDRIGTSFNYHPSRKERGGLDYRTNLYYMQTDDYGKTWTSVDGSILKTPLKNVSNNALVYDYDSEKRNVYIADVNFDKKDRPVILFITSSGPLPGPEDGPRYWHTAWWNGRKWEIRQVTTAGNNYDVGSIYIEKENLWRIVAPTAMGPQDYNTGGEMEMWESKDQGKTWTRLKKMTNNSVYNHTYARRPVNVHPDFYAFWADGHGRQPSESRLYFCDKKGRVYQLPQTMKEDSENPILIENK
jgi:hypothetical protein